MFGKPPRPVAGRKNVADPGRRPYIPRHYKVIPMKKMQYISTRGRSPAMGFQDAVMTGLAADGGLLIPASVPSFKRQLGRLQDLPYADLALAITRRFVDIPDADLKQLLDKSYGVFRHREVAPVVRVGDLYIQELFHGPTLAFKDIALQWLGNLFEYILQRTGRRLNILAATSGDTGSAAIYGVRGRDRINIFVMHPSGRVSPTQERQMTAVLDPNVFNIAVQGTFDDCQNIMKTIFRDVPFKEQHALGSVNSVNWARVLAQTVYYFYAALRVMRDTGADRVQFAVPTGNFGDILAGYYAWRMGLPISRLVLATNENDILARFFKTGAYSLGHVVPTLSPSMDIQVASNFERYLYYRLGADSAKLREWMTTFEQQGANTVPRLPDGRVDELMVADAGTTPDTLAAIRKYYEQYQYLMDPHTAVGVAVGERFAQPGVPTICLATAHPAKFGQAIRDATGKDLAHHELLDALSSAPTRCTVLPAKVDVIKAYMEQHVG